MLLSPKHKANLYLAQFGLLDSVYGKEQAAQQYLADKEVATGGEKTRLRNQLRNRLKANKGTQRQALGNGPFIEGTQAIPNPIAPSVRPADRFDRIGARRLAQRTSQRAERLGLQDTNQRQGFEDAVELVNSPEAKELRKAIAILDGRIPGDTQAAKALLQNNSSTLEQLSNSSRGLAQVASRGRNGTIPPALAQISESAKRYIEPSNLPTSTAERVSGVTNQAKGLLGKVRQGVTGGVKQATQSFDRTILAPRREMKQAISEGKVARRQAQLDNIRAGNLPENKTLEQVGGLLGKGATKAKQDITATAKAGGNLLGNVSNAVADRVLGPKADISTRITSTVKDAAGNPIDTQQTITRRGVRVKQPKVVQPVNPRNTGKGLLAKPGQFIDDRVTNIATRVTANLLGNGDPSKVPDAIADIGNKVSKGTIQSASSEVGNLAKKGALYGGGGLLAAGAVGLGAKSYLDRKQQQRDEEYLNSLRNEYGVR